jgi:hypothetical protein
VSAIVLDDHLLRDLLADDIGRPLTRLLQSNQPATTNLYYARLCRSAVSSRGGQLTGTWPTERRQALAEALLALPLDIEIVPMRALAFRMAGLAEEHRLSTLGAEAVAAAAHLRGSLVVSEADDGPGIRACAKQLRIPYRAIGH